jgi:hypothetical protein
MASNPTDAFFTELGTLPPSDASHAAARGAHTADPTPRAAAGNYFPPVDRPSRRPPDADAPKLPVFVEQRPELPPTPPGSRIGGDPSTLPPTPVGSELTHRGRR